MHVALPYKMTERTLQKCVFAQTTVKITYHAYPVSEHIILHDICGNNIIILNNIRFEKKMTDVSFPSTDNCSSSLVYIMFDNKNTLYAIVSFLLLLHNIKLDETMCMIQVIHFASFYDY